MEKRRKILMLIPELGYGGAEKSFLRLSNLLSKYHDVQIAVFKRHYAQGDYAQSDDELTLPLTILDDKEYTGRFKRWKNRWKNLNRLKKESDITISFLTGANILNASVFSKGKTIVSMRGSRRFDPNPSRLTRFIYEYLIDPVTFMFSDRIVSISDGLSNELSTHVPAGTKKKIRTIELFVNAQEMIDVCTGAIEPEIEKAIKTPTIITVGRLSKEKGFKDLISVFKKVLVDIPSAKLIIIGDGPQKNELSQHCKKLNISYCHEVSKIEKSSVIFLGYRKNPCRYLSLAKCFVLSSLTEGFSNTTLEALANGTPIIAVDSPWGPRSILWDTPENITDPYPTKGITQADYGLLMSRIDIVGNHDEWTIALREKLLTEVIDENIIKKNQNRLYDFDLDVIGNKWLSLIDELY